jgi:UPF0716 protein FxsA
VFWWVVGAIILLPVIELWGLIAVGSWIGTVPTILMVIFSGVVGAWLAKREGLRTWKLATIQLQNGEIPADTLLDGILILIGGVFLITPGFLTDVMGFLLVFPYTRSIIRFLLKSWLAKKLASGEFIWIQRKRW